MIYSESHEENGSCKEPSVVANNPSNPRSPKVRAVWQSWSNRGDVAMLWSAATTVCAASDSSEQGRYIVVPSDQGFDGAIHLVYGDVRADNIVTPQYLEVRIKASKTEVGVGVRTLARHQAPCAQWR